MQRRQSTCLHRSDRDMHGGPYSTLSGLPTRPSGSSAVFTTNCPTVPTTITTGMETFTVTTPSPCILKCQSCATPEYSTWTGSP